MRGSDNPLKHRLGDLAVVLGAAVFMTWGASYYTVFDDEAFSTQRYVLPLRKLIPALWHGVEPDPPLYYVLQHAWVTVFGVRPLALRGLSIVCFLAALPVIRAAGDAWFGRRAGRLALLLCGLHPLHLFFGFAARWYSLMFLCVAVLLLASAMIARHRGGREWMVVWALAALAAMYTNYFGVCVVGLLWLWGHARGHGGTRGWRRIAGLLLLLYSPWVVPFVRTLWHFPDARPDAMAYGATAGRTIVPLLTGNLASLDAWYVWGPLAAFAAAACLLCVTELRRIGPLLWLCGGCLVTGIASQTMIDKYVMCFSGAVWLVAAAVLAGGRHGFWRHVRSAAVAGLCLGWAGCGINWVIEERWSSLRWLDPFRQVVYDNLYARAIVATHPSVRYYYGFMDPDHWRGRVGPDRWRRRAAGVWSPDEALAQVAAGPLPSLEGRTDSVCVIETAAIRSDDPAWPDLLARLQQLYPRVSERHFLPDPQAALKDRLDPRYVHPPWRIRVRTFAPAGTGEAR